MQLVIGSEVTTGDSDVTTVFCLVSVPSTTEIFGHNHLCPAIFALQKKYNKYKIYAVYDTINIIT